MRIKDRWRRRREAAVLRAVDPRAVVPAGMWTDDAVASSAVLAEVALDGPGAVVVRHVLALPADAVAGAAATAGLDGYAQGSSRPEDPVAGDGLVGAALERVMLVDPRTLSQERSRMASLASRSGGSVLALMILR